MLDKLMQALGYVPADELVTMHAKVTALNEENEKLRFSSRKLLDEVKVTDSADKLRITDLEMAAKRLKQSVTIAEATIAKLVDPASYPAFAVVEGDKTLELQAAMRKDVLVIKSTVKNNKNRDHLNALARSLNLMMQRRIEDYKRLVANAVADANAPEGAPLDKPLGVPVSSDKPKGFA